MDDEILKIWKCIDRMAALDNEGTAAIAKAFDTFVQRMELLEERLKFTEDRMLEHEKVIAARSEVTDEVN